MREEIRHLFGSQHENQWRYDHKEIAKLYPEAEYWTACNGDLFLMKNRRPIALIDIKKPESILTKTEKDLYKWMIMRGCPVFIIRGNSLWNCNVYRYETNGEEVFVNDNYIQWERKLRT